MTKQDINLKKSGLTLNTRKAPIFASCKKRDYQKHFFEYEHNRNTCLFLKTCLHQFVEIQ